MEGLFDDFWHVSFSPEKSPYEAHKRNKQNNNKNIVSKAFDIVGYTVLG